MGRPGPVAGFLLVAAGVAAAVLANQWTGVLSVLTLAVILGVLVRTAQPLPANTAAGVAFAGKPRRAARPQSYRCSPSHSSAR